MDTQPATKNSTLSHKEHHVKKRSQAEPQPRPISLAARSAPPPPPIPITTGEEEHRQATDTVDDAPNGNFCATPMETIHPLPKKKKKKNANSSSLLFCSECQQPPVTTLGDSPCLTHSTKDQPPHHSGQSPPWQHMAKHTVVARQEAGGA